MDTWELLQKELEYYGIHLIDDMKCKILEEDGTSSVKGNIKAVRQLRKEIKKHIKMLSILWDSVISVLEPMSLNQELCDDKIKKIFIFSLKDMSKFLLMFSTLDNSFLTQSVDNALSRDINSFSKEQISSIIDYKISIDWIHRSIQRLQYICRLLACATTGKKKVSLYDIKTARSVAGPWSNLDLPMLERTFPFELEEQMGREKDKQKQRRYTKGQDTYHSPGVGEGHYLREVRNEPYDFYDASDNPYPHRNLLWH